MPTLHCCMASSVASIPSLFLYDHPTKAQCPRKECVQELMKIEENQLSEDLGKMNIYNLMALQGAISAVFVAP